MMGGPVQPGYRHPQAPYSYGGNGHAAAFEQARFMQQVLANFGLSLLVAGGGAYVGSMLPPVAFLPLVLVEFLLLLAMMFARRVAGLAPFLVFGFALVSGALTYPTLLWATTVTGGTGVVVNALAVTGGIFVAMASYGLMAKRDLAGWAPFLWIGLIGSVIASFVGLFFFQTTGFQLLLSMAIVITFTGFVAYDMNQIKANWREYDVMSATLTLYLDFLNLFLAIVRILAIINGGGGRRD